MSVLNCEALVSSLDKTLESKKNSVWASQHRLLGVVQMKSTALRPSPQHILINGRVSNVTVPLILRCQATTMNTIASHSLQIALTRLTVLAKRLSL